MDAIPALASFSREKLIDNLIVRGRKARILSVWMLMQKDTWFLLSTTAQQLLFIVILLLEEKCIMWASLGFGINLLVTDETVESTSPGTLLPNTYNFIVWYRKNDTNNLNISQSYAASLNKTNCEMSWSEY